MPLKDLPSTESTALNVGVQAIACFTECARVAAPVKSRMPIARLLWLLKMCASCSANDSELEETLEASLKKAASSIPAANWLFWWVVARCHSTHPLRLNEIIADIRQRPHSTAMVELLSSVGEAFPQQVFHALRVHLPPEAIAERIAKGGGRGVVR